MSTRAPAAVSRAELASEMEAVLRRHVLHCWFPRCVDARGGFQQNYGRDWQALPDQKRTLVFQARMLWVTATTARLRGDLQAEYSAYAEHGFRNLIDNFVDSEHGGLFIDTDDRDFKHSYAMSFGVFACAAYYRLTGEPDVLEILQRLFHWWARNASDRQNGGCFDLMQLDGTPIVSEQVVAPVVRVPATQRTSNTHLHAMEALTELYLAWPDPEVAECLRACLGSLEQTIAEQGGKLFASYSRSWQPINRDISFGHDIEAYMLCTQARHALGKSLPSPAETLASSALRRGLDSRIGGLFAGRRVNRPFVDKRKLGWPQAEALHGFLLRSNQSTADARAYWNACVSVWKFITRSVVDPIHTGTFAHLDRRGNTLDDRKGHQWKACYHFARALLCATDLLSKPVSANQP